MKTFLALLVAVFVADLLVIPVNAQVGFSQRAWLRGTTVIVWNATDDRKPVRIFVDEKNVDRVLRHGEQWSASFGGGLVIQYNPGQRISLVITAKGCENSQTNFVVPPPDWASDQSLLGVLALTQDYLNTDPSEKELKARVKDIKKFLGGRLGRDRMRKDLDEWFNAVKKVGLSFSEPNCGGPDIEGVRVDFDVDTYNQSHRAIAVYVRGDSVNGYKIEGPRFIAY